MKLGKKTTIGELLQTHPDMDEMLHTFTSQSQLIFDDSDTTLAEFADFIDYSPGRII